MNTKEVTDVLMAQDPTLTMAEAQERAVRGARLSPDEGELDYSTQGKALRLCDADRTLSIADAQTYAMKIATPAHTEIVVTLLRSGVPIGDAIARAIEARSGSFRAGSVR